MKCIINQITLHKDSKMTIPIDLKQQFRARAEFSAATVAQVGSLEEALAYTVDVCDAKEACQLLPSGCAQELSEPAGDLCERKAAAKLIAAPGLDQELLKKLETLAGEKSIQVTEKNLRAHLAGLDVGFVIADYAIAETGSCVVDSTREDVRLATMLSEVNILVVRASTLKASADELEPVLTGAMQGQAGFWAFITGPSRTADIERVLALGAHGPLQVHVLIWEDK